jgi:putative transposase
MARALRDKEAGVFHVTCHSVRDTALFRDDLDRTRFLIELANVTGRLQWTCIGFCLMTTHFHLLLEVDANQLPVGMHALNFRYACAFNSRHRTRGHVLERRYSAGRIASEIHLINAFRYVAHNPVAARMCERPQEWPWSSYASTVGLIEPHSFVDATRAFEAFGHVRELAIARLRSFVEES